MGMYYYSLTKFKLPHIRIYEDGTLFDENKNRVIVPQPKSGNIELVSPITNNRVRISAAWLHRYYYNVPWHPRHYIPCRHMRDIGFSNYVALEDGRIFSCITYDYLIGNMSFDGYKRVLVKRDNGTFITIGIHRLIAMTFIPNPENKKEVNHIDGDKLNNSVKNLEWVTPSENMEHALHNGLRKFATSDETIHQICKMLERGDRVMDICNELDIQKHVVLSVKSGCHARISKLYDIPLNKHF